MAKSDRPFPIDDIEDLICGGGPDGPDGPDGLDLISDEITDQGRWQTHHEVIFENKPDGKFYKTWYSRGSTEYQDNGIEFQDENDGNVLCVEVVAKQVMTTVYVDAEKSE